MAQREVGAEVVGAGGFFQEGDVGFGEDAPDFALALGDGVGAAADEVAGEAVGIGELVELFVPRIRAYSSWP